MVQISTYFEWFYRLSVIVVSVVQFLIISSKSSEYCIKFEDLLTLESQWLAQLITLQMAKVVVFSFWKIRLVNQSD